MREGGGGGGGNGVGEGRGGKFERVFFTEKSEYFFGLRTHYFKKFHILTFSE